MPTGSEPRTSLKCSSPQRQHHKVSTGRRHSSSRSGSRQKGKQQYAALSSPRVDADPDPPGGEAVADDGAAAFHKLCRRVKSAAACLLLVVVCIGLLLGADAVSISVSIADALQGMPPTPSPSPPPAVASAVQSARPAAEPEATKELSSWNEAIDEVQPLRLPSSSSSPPPPPPPPPPSPPPPPLPPPRPALHCGKDGPPVIFLHQQKAGGHNIKVMLAPNLGYGYEQRQRWLWHGSGRQPPGCKCRGGTKLGYSFSRPACWSKDCSAKPPAWITVTRDPWARMKSAFYYCDQAKNSWDPLCHLGPLPKDWSERPCEFGRRWASGGGYQFAAYLGLDYDRLKRLPCAPARCDAPAPAGDAGNACIRFALRACQLDSNTTDASRALIADAFRAQESFLAIGLVEEFEASMRLFERETGCTGLSEHVVNKSHSSLEHKVGQEANEKRKVAEAQFDSCNPELMQLMSIDQKLYAHAKQLFERQRAGAAGLTGAPLSPPKSCTQAKGGEVACG